MVNSNIEHNPVTGRDVVCLEEHCTGNQGRLPVANAPDVLQPCGLLYYP